MNFFAGTYVGFADVGLVSGVGFKPDVVWINELESGGTEFGSIGMASAKTTGPGDSFSGYSNSAWDVGLITMNSDGFSLTNSVKTNVSGRTYFFMCLSRGLGGNFFQSKYVGNGNPTQPISGVGFAPEFVFVRGFQSGFLAYWIHKDMAAGEGKNYGGSGVATLDVFDSLDSDGFTVDTSDGTNAAGVTYHYFAARSQTGVCEIGTYTGNGMVRTVSLSDSTITPNWMMTSYFRALSAEPTMSQTDMLPTSVEAEATNDVTDSSDGITAFGSGTFKLGNGGFVSNNVNRNLSKYFYIVFENNNELPNGAPPATRPPLRVVGLS